MLIAATILALAIGMSLGLLGGGGSILTMPVLHYAFDTPAHDAIATSLVVVGITSVVALVGHARRGHVRWKLGLVFGATSMVTAFAGGRLGAVLPAGALIVGFAVVMIAAGVAMLQRARSNNKRVVPSGEASLRRVLGIAAGIGLLTGILGAGGGFLIVPALTLAGGLAVREAIGTSLLVIGLNAGAGFAGTAPYASVDARIALVVTLMAVAGSLIGARLGRRLSTEMLERGFGWFVIIVGAAIVAQRLFQA